MTLYNEALLRIKELEEYEKKVFKWRDEEASENETCGK